MGGNLPHRDRGSVVRVHGVLKSLATPVLSWWWLWFGCVYELSACLHVHD